MNDYFDPIDNCKTEYWISLQDQTQSHNFQIDYSKLFSVENNSRFDDGYNSFVKILGIDQNLYDKDQYDWNIDIFVIASTQMEYEDASGGTQQLSYVKPAGDDQFYTFNSMNSGKLSMTITFGYEDLST